MGKRVIFESKSKKNFKKTKIGDFTDPIVIPGGFLILYIEEKREIEKEYDLENEIKLIAQKKLMSN